jgi:UDP-glucose 4-epimerase
MDREAIASVFARHPVERVIHGAAVTSDARRESEQPDRIVDVNLQGTLNVLAAARDRAVRRVVFLGSGAAYGETLYRLPRIDEESASVPTTLYSITKHAAERLCLRMRSLWDLDVVCVRLGTVIGPWERHTGVRDNYGTHTQLAADAAAGRTAVLTEREVQRDWVYAVDVAQAVRAIAHAGKLAFPVYNVSSGMQWLRPIRAWCEALKAAYPRFSYHVARDGEQPTIWYTDRDRGLMAIERLKSDVGYAPRYPMVDAYAAYIEWMKRTPDFLLEQ